MTLAQLANFVRIAELQSLSKAAVLVRIAQPALSRQVRHLEAELGTQLLVRHAWGVTLTPSGITLLASARRLLQEAEGLRDAVHASATNPTGRLALGVPASIAPSLLPPLADRLMRKYPYLRPHLVEGFSATLHARLLSGELDMAVFYEDRGLSSLSSTPLLTENLLLVGSPAAAVRGTTTSRLLRSGVLILPARPNRLRLIVDEALAGNPELEPRILEIDSVPAILELVEQGLGFTVLPYSTVFSHVRRQSLKVWDLAAPPLARTLVLVRPKERAFSPAIAAVEAEVHWLTQELAESMKWHALVYSSPDAERA